MAKTPAQTQSTDEDAGLFVQWRANRAGFAGMILSAVQLGLHGLWISVTEQMARGDGELSPESWQAWLIVGLLLLSGATTMLALFLSLLGCIHGRPRAPAVIGLVVSFFTGTLLTFVLLLTALASGGS